MSWIDNNDYLQSVIDKIPESISGDIRTKDVTDLLLRTYPNVLPEYSRGVEYLTIAKINEVYKEKSFQEAKQIIHGYEQNELLYITDYSKPNFMKSEQDIYNRLQRGELSQAEVIAYKNVVQKSVNPLRLSHEEAVYIEEVTRERRWIDLKDQGALMDSVDVQNLEIALFRSSLSMSSFARYFFYPNKHESGQTLTPENFNIHPFQKTFMECNNNWIAGLISRQRGKSTVLHIALMWYIIFKKGFRGFFIGPTVQATEKFLSELITIDKKSITNTKVDPYLLTQFGKFSFQGTERNMVFKRMAENSADSKIYVAHARGQKRFVGTTIQGLFVDEIATYEVNPLQYLMPVLDSFKHYGFAYYTTTQRYEGNPFIQIMSNPDIKLVQSNVYCGHLDGTITDDELRLFRNRSPEEGFQTEYECVIPEAGGTSSLTLTDIANSADVIDTKLNKNRKFNEPYKVWELGDKRLFEHYDLVEYTMGVDWNGNDKGNVIQVLATVVDKNSDNIDLATGEEKIDYKYVPFETFKIKGNLSVYNTAVMINTLIDKFNINMVYADLGFSDSFITLYATNSELQRTPGGKVVYEPRIENDSDQKKNFKMVEFISFQSVRKLENEDGFGNIHKTSYRLGTVLINSIINYIKDKKMLLSKYESSAIRLQAVQVIDGDIEEIPREELYDEVEESDGTTKIVEVKHSAKEIYLGPRVKLITNKNEKLDYKLINIHNINDYTKFYREEITFVDELRNMQYDEVTRKYIIKNKSKKDVYYKIEDDSTIALGLALYPQILKHDKFIAFGLMPETTTTKGKKPEEIEDAFEQIIEDCSETLFF